MARVRPLEVKALLPLLERDWEKAEDLISSLIVALDEVRSSRKSWFAVVRLGKLKTLIGVGPYPGQKSAINALMKFPIGDKNLISGYTVAEIESPLGFDQRLKDLDKGKDAA